MLRTLSDHTAAVKVLKHLNSSFIVSGSDDNTIKAWNATDNSNVCSISKHKDWIRDMEILSDGKMISASDDGSIRFINIDSCEQTDTITVGHYVLSLKLINSNKHLAAGCQDSIIRVYDLTNDRELIHNVTLNDSSAFEVKALAYWNETFLISGDNEGRINIWNTTSWELVATLDDFFTASITRLKVFKWNNADHIMSSDSKGIVRVWSLEDRAFKFKLDSGLNAAMFVDVFPEKSQVVGVSYDGTVNIWDLAKTEIIETLKIKLNYYAGVYTFLKLDSECKHLYFKKKIDLLSNFLK